MTPNITTLALNLMISERASHRRIFAEKITKLVKESNDVSGKEKLLKNNFLSILTKCVENPNCEYRELFFQISEYYHQKITGLENAAA